MKIVRYILLLILSALLVWGVFWARNKAKAELCTSIDVKVENTEVTSFVTPQGIINDLQKLNFKIVGLPMWQINSDSIEKALSKSQFLESAQCYKGQNGVFHISVKQLVPVLRVFDGDNSYYVNREGKRIPSSTNYFTDVPIIEGHFTKAYGPEKLLPMIDYVSHDSTLSSIVTMYKFRDPQNIYIVPCFNGHVVNMGDVENYKDKFRKLLLFYRKVMPVKGWNAYDTISVKWDHQVVATLAQKKVLPKFEYDFEDEDPVPDLETMTPNDEKKPLVNDKKSSEKDKGAKSQNGNDKPKATDTAKAGDKPKAGGDNKTEKQEKNNNNQQH